jgi:ABC-type multidrug transport system ATPase subunit
MVFGLLGPNGSGKTTTLGMLLGVINPSSGSFSWFDQGKSHKVRKSIGAILEQPSLYPYMTAVDNLKLVCKIKECPTARIDEVLDLVGLTERKNDSFKTYSLGMKQRLAIASALVCDPQVLLLDEPTNGLDPEGIAEIRKLIREIANMNKTIILASHLLDEVQKVCSDFCVLRKGKLLHQGSVEGDLHSDITLEIGCENIPAVIELLSGIEGISQLKEQEGILHVRGGKSLNALDINKRLVAQNIVVSHLQLKTKSLEEQFLEILKDD